MNQQADHTLTALIPIEKLRLDAETYTLLKNARIKTVKDILEAENGKGLLRIRNIGRKHYIDVQKALVEIGVALSKGEKPEQAGSNDNVNRIEGIESSTPASERELSQIKTVAFVDYEHWYVALREHHQRKPNLQAWFDDLKKRGKLLEVTFFGDFSDAGGMRDEINNIRRFTNRIIETKNVSAYAKKSFTDFIMLDNIYQRVISSPEIEQVVLFTGDGDFCSVASYLRNFCSKVVGIYGVDQAISAQLEATAAWCERIPFSSEPYMECRIAILKNLKYAETHSKSPTFRPTVRLTAEHYDLYEDAVEAELRLLLQEGIIYTMPERSRRDYTIMLNVLKVRWDMVSDLIHF